MLKDGLEHAVEAQEDVLGGSFLISVSPLYDPGGKLIRSVHVAHDITEQKKVEVALKKKHMAAWKKELKNAQLNLKKPTRH
nr:hypothetical protein [Methanosarcina horonobensis]